MKVAIVVGMQQEANIVGSPDNAVVVIGAGNPTKQAADINAAIDAGCDHVLSFGTCGALVPTLEAGAVVIGVMVTNPAEASVLYFDVSWTGRLSRATGAKLVSAAYSPTTIAASADKIAFGERTRGQVVDCETWIAAQVAHARGVPCAMVRAVSDGAAQSLTAPAVGVALNASGGVNPFAVAKSVIEDPAQLPELAALGESARLAFNALAQALADIGVDFEAA